MLDAAGRHEEHIETNGITLRTIGEGDGPLAILLHGFPRCWYLWRHQIDPLKEAGFRVAVPDQRGYGASSRQNGSRTTTSLSSQLMSLDLQMHLERKSFI